MRSFKYFCSHAAAFFLLVFAFFLFTSASAFAQAPCPLSPVNPSVTICTPASGGTVTSPVRVVAGVTDSRRVTVLQIYLDGVKVYQVNSRTLDKSLPMAVGTRRLTVQARDSAAKWFKQTINVNVVSSLPAVSVSVAPASANIATGATQQFTATVSGSANTAVTWSATGGTISASGVYTAPSTAATYTVKATSVADPSKSASATVTVTAAPAVAVAVSPTSASVQPGATKQFTANVTGTTNTAVTWSATGGTISAGGLYIAPATAGNYTVRATSVADTSKSASAAVTVAQAPPTIAVSPSSITFSSIPAANTSSQAVVVTNTGGSALTVTQATVSGSTVFSVTAPAFPITLNAGQSGSVTVQFAPQAAGTFNGSVALVSNASNTVAAIPLSGTATAPSTMLLSASPTSVSFGSVVVGSTLTRAVTLTNTGNSSVTVFSGSPTGAGFTVTGTTFPFNIAAAANRAVNIQFAPQSSGAVTGSVSFSSNATNTPTNVALSGTGTAAVQHAVDLVWNASTSAVSGYNVYRGTQTGGPYAKLNSALLGTLQFTDSSVQSGRTYVYVIRAVDSQGRESANSNEVTALIPTP